MGFAVFRAAGLHLRRAAQGCGALPNRVLLNAKGVNIVTLLVLTLVLPTNQKFALCAPKKDTKKLDVSVPIDGGAPALGPEIDPLESALVAACGEYSEDLAVSNKRAENLVAFLHTKEIMSMNILNLIRIGDFGNFADSTLSIPEKGILRKFIEDNNSQNV